MGDSVAVPSGVSLSIRAARRVALAAQGLGRRRTAAPGIRQLDATIARLGLLQLDSVNVFERSHYLPLFARLGAYDRARLDTAVFAGPGAVRPGSARPDSAGLGSARPGSAGLSAARPRPARSSPYVEYWAHEAAVIPTDDFPLFRWRMQHYRDRAAADPSHWMHSNAAMMTWLAAALREKGPLRASEIEHDANKRSGPWWGWSEVKNGLEVMFRTGDVVSAGRTRFERTYALPNQVLPAEVVEREVSREDAHLELVRRATRAHGIGTAADFGDYYRLAAAEVLVALRELEERGEIVPAHVEGWNKAAWLHRDARVPRKVEATALLSPFDPVVWFRPRAERLFDFHYRIEIYTPAERRVFGYYSLPLLIDEALVGRVDLKSDRQSGVLRVQSAWTEEGVEPGPVAERLVPLLREAAEWQGLGAVEVSATGRGTLLSALTAELA